MCVKEQEEQRGQSAKEDPHPKRQKTCEWATDTQTLRASVLKRRPVGDNAIMQRHRSCCCTAVLRVKRFVTSCAVLCGAVRCCSRVPEGKSGASAAVAVAHCSLQIAVPPCRLWDARCIPVSCSGSTGVVFPATGGLPLFVGVWVWARDVRCQ